MNTMLRDYDATFRHEDYDHLDDKESENKGCSKEASEKILEIGKMFCDKYSSIFEELAK